MLSFSYLIPLMIATTFGRSRSFDVVVHFPSKLPYDKEQSFIFTTFHSTPGEYMTANIDVRHETSNRNILTFKSSFSAPSNVATHRALVRVNSSSEHWNTRQGSDVMFYVIVNVTMTSSLEERWTQEKRIPVVKLQGHIFIQTDRPVYRPGDEVLVRFIPVDTGMKPLKQPMSMSILAPNPDPSGSPLLSWYKRKMAKNKVLIRKFLLPVNPPLGRWRIVANFFREEMVSNEFSADFFVKDVTLPTFDFSIRPIRESFIVPDDAEFPMEVIANFFYGKDVEGTASIKVGLFNSSWTDNELVTSDVMSPKSVEDGRLPFNVSINSLLQQRNVNQTSLFIGGTRLLVEASVTERGSGQTRLIRNDDVVLTSSPLLISLNGTPHHFKPGLPFIFKVEATYINGSACARLQLHVTAHYNGSDGRPIPLFDGIVLTNDKGRSQVKLMTPINSAVIDVTVRGKYISSRGIQYATKDTMKVYKQISTHEEYMQLVMERSAYVVDRMGSAQLYFTPTHVNKTIAYTITNGENYYYRGHVTANPNENKINFTFPISSEMSSTSYLAAYYVTRTATGLPFVVADSAVVEVENRCNGVQLDVTFPGHQRYHPGGEVEMDVHGDPLAHVGLTGVDVALRSLEKELSNSKVLNPAALTRDNLFSMMKAYAPGCKIPVNPYPESSFPLIGRTLLSSAGHNTTEAANDVCHLAEVSSRKKRGVSSSTSQQLHSMELMKTEWILDLEHECCNAGAHDVRAVMTSEEQSCQKRAATVVMGESCRRRFLECCRESLSKWAKFRSTSSRNLHRNVPANTNHIITDRSTRLVRKDFAWTWFNSDFLLRRSGLIRMNRRSKPPVSRLPDSVTSWSIEGFSLSKDQGMCVMDPLTLTVKRSLFITVTPPQGRIVRGSLDSVEVTLYNYLPHQVTVDLSLDSDENICTRSNSKVVDSEIAPSRGNVASKEAFRFNFVPHTSGAHDITIIMKAKYQNRQRHRVEKVTKTIIVEEKDVQQRQVEWKLIDTRHSSRERIPSTFDLPPPNLAFPVNSISGSKEAQLRYISLESALLGKPVSSSQDASIAPYLYSLQFILSKIETRELNSTELEAVTREAETAYNGLLTFARKSPQVGARRRRRRRRRRQARRLPLYGFSFLPKEKPELLLTCAVLRTICRITELIDIELNRTTLRGSLKWVLLHQNYRGFFKDEPSFNGRRLKRGSSVRSHLRSLMDKRRNRRQSNSAAQTTQSGRLDRRIYRCAVVGSFLDSVMKSINSSSNRLGREGRTGVFNSNDVSNLRSVLRKTRRYISNNIMRIHRNGARPVTLAAALRAIFMMKGRINPTLVNSLMRWKQVGSNNEEWWIQGNETGDVETPIEIRNMDINSLNIEATAYTLQLKALSESSGIQYAIWLLKQRITSSDQMSPKATLATMIAMESFVVRANLTSQNNSMYNEQDMTYNTPENSSDPVSQSGENNLCPFHVSAKVKSGERSLPRARGTWRSAGLSDRVIDVELGIRYKSWYDNEHSNSSYVIDFGLPPNYVPITTSLDKLSSSTERAIDHYRISERALLLYMSEERNITFNISKKRTHDNTQQIPIVVYSTSNPERRCKLFYSDPYTPTRNLTSFCSCPWLLTHYESSDMITETRSNYTCKPSTKFAYSVQVTASEEEGDWILYHGYVNWNYKISARLNELLTKRKYTFRMKKSCDAARLSIDADYLVFGKSVEDNFEHILDFHSRVEEWPGGYDTRCANEEEDSTRRKACLNLEDYDQHMRKKDGCSN